MESLKVLDPRLPIREADIVVLICSLKFVGTSQIRAVFGAMLTRP